MRSWTITKAFYPMVLSLCKTCLIRFILFKNFICFVILLSLWFSALNFTFCITYTASCSVFGCLLFLNVYCMDKSCINHPYFLLSGSLTKTTANHTPNAFLFILIIYSASFTSSNFWNSLVVLKKRPKKFSPIKL